VAIRTGWLDDVDLTGRGWWSVAEEIANRHGSGAVRQLLDANFFEQFGSFSAGDRAALWNFVGGKIAGEQHEASDDALKSALKSVIGGAVVGTGMSIGAGLAGSALVPWLSGLAKSVLPTLPSVSSLVPTQVSNALTAFDTVRAAPGAWLNEYFDPAAAVGGAPQFFTDTQGGGGMDIRETFRALLAPLLGNSNDAAQAVMGAAPMAAPPLLAMGMMPTLGRVGTFLGGAASATAGVLRSAAGRILGVILPSGVKVSRKSVVSLAKTMGVQGAATALGIGAVELAEMVMEEEMKKGRGRGRGVTGAQLRTTRTTMRKVERMHRQIASYARDAGVCAPRRPRIVYAAAPKALPFRRG